MTVELKRAGHTMYDTGAEEGWTCDTGAEEAWTCDTGAEEAWTCYTGGECGTDAEEDSVENCE